MPSGLIFAQGVLNTARGSAMPAWTPYLALFLDDPLGGGAEVAGGAYARQAVVFQAPSGNTMVNSNTINFPAPTGVWGSPAYMALMDAPTGGNIRQTWLLAGTDTERLQQPGVTPVQIVPGSLIFTVA